MDSTIELIARIVENQRKQRDLYEEMITVCLAKLGSSTTDDFLYRKYEALAKAGLRKPISRHMLRMGYVPEKTT